MSFRFLHQCFAILLLLVSISAYAEEPLYFIYDPSISPDGETVVFGYDDDLWLVSVQGGVANRITAMDGRESAPRFSPDGKWLAFSASLDGNVNVFVMPVDGGEIKQLTFHQAADVVNSWSWDSRDIYFHSSRYNMASVYKVPVTGGTPVRLFDHYFNMPHHLVQHPVSGAFIFTESWESLNFSHRKRYKGANSPDILSYDAAEERFQKLTDYEGKDLWPTIDQQGNVYFASDAYNDTYNLYTLSQGEEKLLTQFDTPIGWPQVSANGKKIVFEKEYQLAVYDVERGLTTIPPVFLARKNTLSLSQNYDVKGQISAFDVSPDNKKLAFVSRGELFVADVEGKFVRHLVTNAEERVLEVMWASDNKTIFFIRTHRGWANLYYIQADGHGVEVQIEDFAATSRLLKASPDRSKAVYLSGRNEVRLLEMSKKTTRLVATDELWAFQNSAPGFSPDGRYLLFTAFRNFEQNIMLHDLDADTTYALTNTGVSERMPSWSPCGKYVYFVSDRQQPNYPRGNTQDRIYRIPLYRFAPPLRSSRFDDLFSDTKKNDSLPPVIRIDLNRIEDRWEEVRIANLGRQWAPQVYRIKGNDIMLFTSNHDKGEWALWKLEQKPFEDNKPVRIEGASSGMSPAITAAKDDLYVLAGGNIHKLNASANKLEPIPISFNFSRNLANEFSQIFYETWAAIDENFYSSDFHGVDWESMRDKYGSHLPHVASRDNLRKLINNMLGELNASHTGFTSSGDEEKTFYAAKTAETGILFEDDNPFTVKRIIAFSRLDLSDMPIMPGDELIRVNGKLVDNEDDRNKYFYFADLPKELHLAFKRGDITYDVRFEPHTPAQISDLLYDEWIAANRKYVEDKSEGRVAYVFMKDMGVGSLNRFMIDMTTHAMDKDALILDIRFNRGGNVHDDVLRFLAQRPYLTWKYRDGALAPQPNFSPAARPIILLINERSLSDAEMTAEGFKRLELGKVVGTETYRWIIFTSGKAMVDGSFCRLPAWGCFTLDGENLEFTGVSPDIDVHNTFEDRLLGRDPQLDAALEAIIQ